MARAYVKICDVQFPESQSARRDAFAGWAHRVDLPAYDRLMVGASQVFPTLPADIAAQQAKLDAAMATEIRRDRTVCNSLAEKLSETHFNIGGTVRQLLRAAKDYGIPVADAPVIQSRTQDVELVPLAVLSAQAMTVMDSAGTKAGALENPDLADARAQHLLDWLNTRPALVVYGRVTSENTLREWRGDQQSSFEVKCSSFGNEQYEQHMAQSVEQNMVIAGTPLWVREDRVGGAIGLGDCGVFTLAKSGVDLPAIKAGDSSGLMLRPPTFGEAYAGPDQGIALGDIDRVLYAAAFSSSINGFGNGYMDRREDVYVLLRDGTAYLHKWSFAFTDLNIGLSRQREPERWFRWSDNGGKVSVAQTGGLGRGKVTELAGAKRLAPMKSEQILDHAYYYLNINAGGGRSDRDYVFTSAGKVTYSRGGVIAGNTGNAYIVVHGDDQVGNAAYRFEDYTMILDGPDGPERHFVAMFDGDTTADPADLLIEGRVYWSREAQ